MRIWSSIVHLPLATRSANGAATTAVRCGSYREGLLQIYLASMGWGQTARFRWETSLDGLRWSTLLTAPTLAATGTQLLVPSGCIGALGRLAWTLSATASFSAGFLLKE